ncbi:hypothetical protein Ae201684P_019261 [Aphanomyces euteiches]|nr:hypothetical protein Ae201684P_019261 [Aphanomyces euteiches]
MGHLAHAEPCAMRFEHPAGLYHRKDIGDLIFCACVLYTHHVFIDQFLEEVESQPNMLGPAVGCSGSLDLYGALIVDEHIDGFFAVSDAAMNSTLVVFWPTMLCFFDIYVIAPPAIVMTDPVIDLLSCLSIAMSASLNAFGLALASPSYLKSRCFVPCTYFTTRFAIF